MPIEIDNTDIIIDDGSGTNKVLDVIKSKGSYDEKAADGATYSCGRSDYGQLGHGNTSNKSTPTLIQYFIDNNINIAQLFSGELHSLFVATNGYVYSCGNGEYGRLGHGNSNHRYTPTLIETYDDNNGNNINYTNITISQISGGKEHSLFLATNGYVYSCGRGSNGRLGHGNSNFIYIPTLIKNYIDSNGTNINYTNITISQISGDQYHSLFLDTNGYVYSCGNGGFSALGHGDTTDRSTPTLIENYIDSNGTSINYTNITISHISVGTLHSLFLDTNGNVYSCGNNNYGQLGHGDTTDKSTPTLIQFFVDNGITISQISVGYYHSLFLATDGRVYSCGNGGSAQLGHGNNTNYYTPTLIQFFVDNGITISQISAGGYHNIFLAANGDLYSCGYGSFGQLGYGNTNYEWSPTLIQFFVDNNITILHFNAGFYHSLFLSNDPYYQTIEYPAQWTYSDTDVSVYHLGNVGIGTEASSTYSLNVAGDVNVNGDIYCNDAKTNFGLLSNYVHDNDPVVYNDNIRTLPVYDNITDSLQKAAEEVSGVKGWRLVRFLPGTATAWHPVNDNLVGTTTYGTAYDYTNAFSVEFGEFDEFMFSNGNMKNWLYATRDQVIGQSYDNAQRTIIRSSISNTSYKARWYNRSSSIDPLISIEDWSVSSTGDKHGILYIEDSYTSHKEYFGNSNGMCVFVRNSTDTISSVATDYTHKYLYFTYNSSSDTNGQTEYNINFPIDTTCDILIVAGGGGGGAQNAGGGGAGGLIFIENYTIDAGTYSIKVGNGATGGPRNPHPNSQRTSVYPDGKRGYNSSLINSNNTSVEWTAIGGGNGGGDDYFGVQGGSGGGGADDPNNGGPGLSVSGILYNNIGTHYGNDGGDARPNTSNNDAGAGGGGASEQGYDNINGRHGGEGKYFGNIFGTNVGDEGWFAGGGGGAVKSNNTSSGTFGNGGKGGGGNGANVNGVGSSALKNTGGGGGGSSSTSNGGNGGSGVIIIRYAVGNRINTLSNWEYSSRFDDVYYMGNVAIGKNYASYAVELDGIPEASGFSIINVDGTITSTTKNFKIEHPIVSNMYLYHGCIEGPRFDNMYRGKKLVVGGYCEVDIDSECNNTGGMTPGTFVALNGDSQLYLQNNQTFDKVRGYIENGKIKIFCINTTENIMVDWLVIGERRDKDVINTTITNSSGKLICEQ